MIKNYFKIAWRNIISHKKTSLVNLTGLTTGMTAAFLIFMWVKNEYSYDRYHHDAASIYRLTTYSKKRGTKQDERTPFILGQEIKRQMPEMQVARIYPLNIIAPTVKVGQDIFKEKSAAYVDENWFNLFSFDFIQGNAAAFNSSANAVVMSATAAKKYFGAAAIIGKVIRVNDADCVVQGVVKDYPANSSFRYDLFISNNVRPVKPANLNRYVWSYSYQTYVKLTSSSVAVINKINALPDADWKANYTVGLLALKDIHFENDLEFTALQHGDKKTTNILLILGALLLVIACINYVNLTTAKATSRIKEVSVKKIIGADRKQLFLQFIIESAIIGVIALICTLVLVKCSLPLFNRFTDNHFIISLTDASLWELLADTLFCTLLLNSIYPALLLSSFKPISALKGNSPGTLKGGSLRKALVIAQFTISVTLVIGTIVIYRQMRFVNAQYNNYDKSEVFSFYYPADDDAKKQLQMETILQQLQMQNSIKEAAINCTTSMINIQNVWGGFDWDGRDKNAHHDITFMPVGLNFNHIVKLSLKQGRWFIPHNKADEKNFILNETAVNELGIHQPVIGQRFMLDKDTGTVIGVVTDFHYLDLRKKTGAVAIGNNPMYNNSFMVKSMPGKQAQALKAAEMVWKKFVPDQPFDYHFASDEFNQLYRTDNKIGTLIWALSLLAVFISCLGLYGLATFSTERRYKEIGIRKVLGASVIGIAQTLSVDFIKLILISILIAFPIGWLTMNKWLQGFAYRAEMQWWILAMAGLLAIFIAIITISFQAIKAAMANPVKSLRSE